MKDKMTRRSFLATTGAALLSGCSANEVSDETPMSGEKTTTQGSVVRDLDPGSFYDTNVFSQSDLEDLENNAESWRDAIEGAEDNLDDAREELKDLEDERWFTLDEDSYKGNGQLVTENVLMVAYGTDDAPLVNPRTQLGEGPNRSMPYILLDEVSEAGKIINKVPARFAKQNDIPRPLDNDLAGFLGEVINVRPYFRDEVEHDGNSLDVSEDFIEETEEQLDDVIDQVKAVEQEYRELLDDGLTDTRNRVAGDIEDAIDLLEGADTTSKSHSNSVSVEETRDYLADDGEYSLRELREGIDNVYDDAVETLVELTATRLMYEHAKSQLSKVSKYEIDENSTETPENGNGGDGENGGDEKTPEPDDVEYVGVTEEIRHWDIEELNDELSRSERKELYDPILDKGYDLDDLFDGEYKNENPEVHRVDLQYEIPEFGTYDDIRDPVATIWLKNVRGRTNLYENDLSKDLGIKIAEWAEER